MAYFPFYWLLKSVTLAWLYLPQTRGADRVYRRVVAPLMAAVEQRLGNAAPHQE